MQRRLRNLDDENDVAGGKQCAYFSGRRNNEAGYIEDAIIKDAEGCLKELPYTCVLYLPDKGLYGIIGFICKVYGLQAQNIRSFRRNYTVIGLKRYGLRKWYGLRKLKIYGLKRLPT